MTPRRLDWPPIITRAADIVDSYTIPVTLRQLFYRLVIERLIPNDLGAYKRLSSLTAQLRRDGEFPPLYDRNRGIVQAGYFASPGSALRALAEQYRLDRCGNQDTSLFLAVEKNALVGLMEEWFDHLGLPVLPLGGYGSEPLERAVRARLAYDDRPAVLIIAGDFDASGMDIGRSFVANTADCWKETIRVGLSDQQVLDFGLPVLQGKPQDSRAARFIDQHPAIHALHDFGRDSKGRRIPVQVEMDAIEPTMLRRLYQDAIDRYWDVSAYRDVLAREHEDRDRLTFIAGGVA